MVASCTSVRVESSGVVVEGLFRAMISRAQLSTDTILKIDNGTGNRKRSSEMHRIFVWQYKNNC